MFPGLALIIVSVMVIIIVTFVINDEKKTIDTKNFKPTDLINLQMFL